MSKKFKWYDPVRAKSYDKFLNFILGGRGIGKTYGFKKDAIKRFKTKGEQFFYIKRHKTDMQNIDTFLNDMIENFPKDKFKISAGKKFTRFYINGLEMGYAMPLSLYANLKSSSFNKVTTIIFDEFLPEKGGYNMYIPNEVEIFLNMVDSIFRQRNGHVYLLANKTSISSPYFSYFNITVNANKEFNTFNFNDSVKQILIQNCGDDYSKGDGEKSRFQTLIQGTRYGDYNSGEFAYDTNDFIAKKEKTARYFATLYLDGFYYGVYIDTMLGKFYIDKDVNMEYPYKYAIGNNRCENMILAKEWRKDYKLSAIVRNFRTGNIWFSNAQVKTDMTYILSKF